MGIIKVDKPAEDNIPEDVSRTGVTVFILKPPDRILERAGRRPPITSVVVAAQCAILKLMIQVGCSLRNRIPVWIVATIHGRIVKFSSISVWVPTNIFIDFQTKR